MIEHITGNLLEADAEALVNTVNTVGVMGKGIALQFRQAYPANYQAYRRACKHGEVILGRMLVHHTGRVANPRYIINFPTKGHWKSKARLEDIESGLRDLIDVVRREGIDSIAVPPLGCGSGGLDWDEVRPRVEAALAALPDVRILLYEPAGAPAADAMRVATQRPSMTPARAALIGLLENYALPEYRLTMLEVQKLVYFLQAAGEPLKMDFLKGDYGPYAEVLHPVLQRIEGHFIRGYGDRSRGASIRLLAQASEEARAFLQNHPETRQRLERVAALIEGFETPYGMELLATVHWLAQEDLVVKTDAAAAVRGVQAWSARKCSTFRLDHVQVAWNRLREQEWI
jgi:O-acetyl-ADP-ribose deacetylase (regulator of RNase III)